MTIATEIQAYNDGLLDAYDAVATKGGTVPTNKNLDNLPDAIESISAGGGGESTGDAYLDSYNATTGVISGKNLGDTSGTVYLLDRDTHTYVAQTVSSWANDSITLATPVDTSTIEGTTCLVAVLPDGTWSTQVIVYGDVDVTGYGLLYVKIAGTVSKLQLTTADDVTALQTATATVQATIDGTSFFKTEIVGFQFGEDFGTSTPDGFLRDANSLNQPIVTTGIQTIGGNFLSACYSMNSLVIVTDSVTSIGTAFMSSLFSFNQPIYLGENITTIGESFLSNSKAFNRPISFPDSLTTIGRYFMQNCKHFNQRMVVPSVSIIQGYFMDGCESFNSPVVIPEGVVSIYGQFLQNCAAFNKPITFSSTFREIAAYFLYNCSAFNQDIILPEGMTFIGNYFLSACSSFSSRVVIPSTVTSVGTYLGYNSQLFNSIEVNTAVHPSDNNTLAATSLYPEYIRGVTVTGTGAATWIAALPDRTTSPYRKLINGNV